VGVFRAYKGSLVGDTGEGINGLLATAGIGAEVLEFSPFLEWFSGSPNIPMIEH
jgi:hypothetical protein